METIHCSEPQLAETLRHLQTAGRQGVECVVLWLARPGTSPLRVERVFRPSQVARADVFRIPPAGMRQLMDLLAAEDLMIAAQVHSHPREAFHSLADHTWAIVRHEHALSLVVPDFALRTNPATFRPHTKVFRLTSANHWVEVSSQEVPRWLQMG